MSESDRALLERFVQQADDEAFVQLYRAHTPMLLLLAQRLIGGAAAAEDAVQETWLRASRGRFNGASAVRTWLVGILLNCCREQRRSWPWSSNEPNDELQPIARSVEPQVDLERAIRALPRGYRDVLLLHDVHGYTHEEIAGLLTIDASTSRSQLSRARERVRMSLNPRSE